MKKAVICNLDDKPFRSFEAASKLRDLLNAEAGYYRSRCRYQVNTVEGNGDLPFFVVTRDDIVEYGQDGSETGGSGRSDNQESGPGIVEKTYRPALRLCLFSLPWIAAALILAMFARELWLTLLSWFDVRALPAWMDGALLVRTTRWAGLLWMTWLIVGILWNYYSTALMVDDRGISHHKGIIVRDVTNVRFEEIRRIGLKQGLLGRLLDVGILEFASSGTDDVDIRFVNIANPLRVKGEIEEMIEISANRGNG